MHEHLFPHAINFSAAFGASAVFELQISYLEAPAFDHCFAAAVTKGIFSGIAGDIAGVYIFQTGL